MTDLKPNLDAHEAPPQELRDLFKRYQKLGQPEIDLHDTLVDVNTSVPEKVKLISHLAGEKLSSSFSQLTGKTCTVDDKPVFAYNALPGLLILPSLLPEHVQKVLLSLLLHRDLSDTRHKTNVHTHYHVPYRKDPAGVIGDVRSAGFSPARNASLFSYSPSTEASFQPKDSAVHKPLSISKVLNRSLRWVTLGGQYDWTKKVYPDEEPPAFPPDIACLLEDLFPHIKAQAAIVNFYTPGDTLSLHRDVSEEVNRPLVSLSIGCDCIFVIGIGQDPADRLVLRLRSGDVIYMSQEARFAWHGVPKILPNTCPPSLKNWPAEEGLYEDWRGWLSNKRVNLNVRQMYAE
ncbi:MAG: hypothetical protein M1818_003310 [Claussenomyces sp. TS43310]|nr:MAG: hypothetical protein M1818_003310 [Claussenomyces sp. TS43310]